MRQQRHGEEVAVQVRRGLMACRSSDVFVNINSKRSFCAQAASGHGVLGPLAIAIV